MADVSVPGPVNGSAAVTSLARLARVLPSLFYMGVIFYISSIPGTRLPLPGRVDDRILHFLEYLGLGVVLLYGATAFARGGLTEWHSITAGLVGIFYGVSDEWHQSFVPYRDASLADIGFDAAGVAAGLAAGWMYLRRRERV